MRRSASLEPYYDAVVVGGGPAGALAGDLLAQQGARVLLLEAAATARRKVCGEYLCPPGVDLLDELGLRGIVGGREIAGMRIVSPRGTLVEANFPSRSGRSPTGLALNRLGLETALLRRARASGVMVRWGARVRDIARTTEGWQLDANGSTVHARLLVGADGRSSRVAKALGLKRPACTDRIALHGYLLCPIRNGHFGEMHLLPDGSYIGVDPTGEHELNVSLICSARSVRALGGTRAAMAHFVTRAPDYFRRYGPYPEHAPLRATSPISHEVREVVAPSAALVGDAAGFVDPLTGEGIYNALRSARDLAAALASVSSCSPVELQYALHRYAAAHRRAVGQKARLNRVFQWIIAKPVVVEGLGRLLVREPGRADAFLGTIANVYRPLEGFTRMLTA